MRTIYIYRLVDPRDESVHYVGKTNRPKIRLKGHCSRRWNTGCAKWVQSLLEYGYRPRIEIIEETDEQRWHEREQYWIAYYLAFGQPLKNVATWQAPGSPFAHQVSDLTRERLRQAFKGRPISLEQRAQISKTLTGKVQTDETVAKRLDRINERRIAQGKSPLQIGVPRKEQKRRYSAGARKQSASYVARKKSHPDKFSLEWKAKIAASLKARYTTLSPEEREQIKQQGKLGGGYWTGKKRGSLSPELKAKLSVIHKARFARQRELKQLCLDC